MSDVSGFEGSSEGPVGSGTVVSGLPARPREDDWAQRRNSLQGESPQCKAASGRTGEDEPTERPRSARVSLGATTWLEDENDEHIAADYALLAEELRQQNPGFGAQIRLIPPALAHQLRLAETPGDLLETLQGLYVDDTGQDTTRFLFFPVNNGAGQFGGSHWSLLFIDRGDPQEPQAHHYDSLEGSAQLKIAGQFAGRLRARLSEAPMARQYNGYDCGVLVLAVTPELVRRLANGQAPEAETLLGNVAADRPALQPRLREQPQIAEEESQAQAEPDLDQGPKPKRRSRKKLDEKITKLVPQAMAAGFGMSREECERIGKRSGGTLALKAFVDHTRTLSDLEFAGETPGTKDKLDKADILKILGHDGAAKAMQALLDKAGALAKLEFSGQQLSKADIVKVLGNNGAAQAVQALLDKADALAKLEFGGQKLSKADILNILGHDGAAKAMQALLDKADALAKLEFGGQKLSKADIVKILGQGGAGQAVQALLDKADALAKLEFSGQKLSKADIVKMLGNNGAAQAVQALLDKADALAKLKFSGQKLSKADIVKMLGNNGAAQAVQALLDKADALAKLEFSGQQLSKADIVKILGNIGAAQAVQALLDKAGALVKLEISGQKLSKADIVNILGQGGAAQAVQALLECADRLKNMDKLEILAAACKQRGAASAIRNLK